MARSYRTARRLYYGWIWDGCFTIRAGCFVGGELGKRGIAGLLGGEITRWFKCVGGVLVG